MWAKRLRARTEDTIIPRKKYKNTVPQNCSQKQDDYLKKSSPKKSKKNIILPHRAGSVPNIEPVTKQKQEIKTSLHPSHTFFESSRISTPIPSTSHVSKTYETISVTPTTLEKLLVTPNRNNEIKISEAGNENDEYNVIVELVDHTVDRACANEPQATKATTSEQSTVPKKTEGLPDVVAPPGTPDEVHKHRSSSRLSVKNTAAQKDNMDFKKSQLSNLNSNPEISTEGCKNKKTHYILTRSRSRKTENMTDPDESHTESSSAPPIKMRPESSTTKPRVGKRKKNVPMCLLKREVYNLPKFRGWPSVNRCTLRPPRALRLVGTHFSKLKNIFLNDNTLKKLNQRWKIRLVDQVQHGGLEWNMYQLYGKNHNKSPEQESEMDDMARKLHRKRTTGAKILNLSNDIFNHVVSEGLKKPVVEVIVHHVEDESTPATAWMIRQRKNPSTSDEPTEGLSAQPFEE